MFFKTKAFLIGNFYDLGTTLTKTSFVKNFFSVDLSRDQFFLSIFYKLIKQYLAHLHIICFSGAKNGKMKSFSFCSWNYVGKVCYQILISRKEKIAILFLSVFISFKASFKIILK